MEENEVLPTGLCDTCQKETDEHKAIVLKGGVYFKCEQCGKTGVIRETAEYAKHVREAMTEKAKKETPKTHIPADYVHPTDSDGKYLPLGIAFNKCEEHGE